MKKVFVILFVTLCLVFTLTSCEDKVENKVEDLEPCNENEGYVTIYLPKKEDNSRTVTKALAQANIDEYLIWAYTNTDTTRYKYVSADESVVTMKAPVGDVTLLIVGIGDACYVDAPEGARTIYAYAETNITVVKNTTTSTPILLKPFNIDLEVPSVSSESNLYGGSLSITMNLPFHWETTGTWYCMGSLVSDEGKYRLGYFEYYYGYKYSVYASDISGILNSSSNSYQIVLRGAKERTEAGQYDAAISDFPRDLYKLNCYFRLDLFYRTYYIYDGTDLFRSGNIQIGAPLGSINATVSWE